MARRIRWILPVLAACAVAAVTAASSSATSRAPGGTATPIRHVVVIFNENISFDHYFGTYPNAANTDGTRFVAKKDTPAVDGLSTALLNNNPNGANPKRLSSSQPLTCDQGHGYLAEQKAYNNGL